MSIEKKTVKQLLREVNEVMNTDLFSTRDELVFLDRDNKLNTKQKMEEVLRYENGWGFLPFADNHDPDYPRITQFNMFVLFAIFGRNYQSKLNAIELQKKKINFHLESVRQFPQYTRSFAQLRLNSFRHKDDSLLSEISAIPLVETYNRGHIALVSVPTDSSLELSLQNV
jgi:hypothetical protein